MISGDPRFWWWDDAMTAANRRAMLSGRKWRVFKAGATWSISVIGPAL